MAKRRRVSLLRLQARLDRQRRAIARIGRQGRLPALNRSGRPCPGRLRRGDGWSSGWPAPPAAVRRAELIDQLLELPLGQRPRQLRNDQLLGMLQRQRLRSSVSGADRVAHLQQRLAQQQASLAQVRVVLQRVLDLMIAALGSFLAR